MINTAFGSAVSLVTNSSDDFDFDVRTARRDEEKAVSEQPIDLMRALHNR